MRFTWTRLALVAVLATSALGLGSRAYAQQSADQTVFVNLKDADMVTATRMLTQKAGVQFLIEPSNEPFGKVTLKLDGVTAEDAVRYICQAAGAYFRRDENGVFIISHTKPEPVVDLTKPVEKPMVVRKLKVLKTDPRDVYLAIAHRVAYDSSRGFEELKKFGSLNREDLNKVLGTDKPANVERPNQTFKPATVGDVTTTKPLTGAESGGDIALPGESANQVGGFGGGRGGGGFGGQGGGFGGQGGGFGGQGGGIGGQGGGIGGQGGQGNLAAGQGLVPNGIDYINYDPTDNSLVVRGTEEAIAQLQTYISMFDVAPRQVIVKVEFITTTARLQNELGYNFSFNRGAFTTGFQPGLPSGAGSVFLSWGTGNWALRLRAVLTENDGTNVSAPMVRTLNNQPASALFLTQIPIFIPQTVINNNQVFTQYNVQFITAATQLLVTPRINDDETITMFLTPQISDITGFSVSPDGQQVPNIAVQAIQVVARVRNNETIVLSGFNSKAYSTTTTRVPVLSEIPIIGQFFRSTSKRQTSSELLIFVTPSIVDEDETAGPGGP
jgi:general secretion pathway protein D